MANERKEALQQLFTILMNRVTPIPVIEHVCIELSHLVCFHQQEKFREITAIKIEQLLSSPDKKNQKALIMLLNKLFKVEGVLLSHSFTQACTEYVMQICEDL
jgi:hypothetical protein